MNVKALTVQERSYLLGLFFADGSLNREKNLQGQPIRSVSYSFQGNEMGLAKKVLALLERAKLMPHLYKARSKNCLYVVASCTNLGIFFPNKKTILANAEERRKFFENSHLVFDLGNRVAFCAGLLDGDGSCDATAMKIRSKRATSVGGVHSRWLFTQTSYPFLLEFFRTTVEYIAAHSTSNVYREGSLCGVKVKRKGREALLRAGMAEWSWKAMTWTKSFSALKDAKYEERVTREKLAENGGIKLVDIAKILGIRPSILHRMYWSGRLKAELVRERAGIGRLVIPRDEAKRLTSLFSERKENVIKIKSGGGVRLTEVARTLGVPQSTLRNLRFRGALKAVLIRGEGNGGLGRLFVPIGEVERLKKIVSEDRENASIAERNGISLIEASKILGLAPSTLRNLRCLGEVNATLVRMGRGRGRLVIQTSEVVRLKEQLSKRRRVDKQLK
jgi:transposase-like protein